MNLRALHDLLGRSIVRIEDGEHLGTGFFAAPGIVLTAAHVVHACPAIDIVWDGQRVTSSSIHRLAQAPDGDYPWPDVAIIEVAIADHPWVPLADHWPLVGAKLFVRAYASPWEGSPVIGTSAAVEYTGPLDWGPGQMLRVTGDDIVSGMSGAPVFDPATGSVCAVVKSSIRTDRLGFATAIADVRANPVLEAARAELDVDAIAAARWGTLLERVAAMVARCGCTDALAAALAVEPGAVARALFDSDLDTFSLALEGLLEERAIVPADAIALFELVACCLPIDAEAAGSWIPGEAADQLRLELAAADPRVAHVPTDRHASLRMLIRRASGRAKLELFGEDAHPIQTPEPDAWFSEVERIVRSAARAPEGWWQKDSIRPRARKRIQDKGLVLPLPPLADPADLDDVRAKLGTFPFVLGGRGPSPNSPRVVRIEPEINADVEESALYYHGTIHGT